MSPDCSRNAPSGAPRDAPGIRGTSSRGRAGLRTDRGGRAWPNSSNRETALRVTRRGKRRNSVRPFPASMTRARPSTFSIVAFDPRTKDLGIAVESKFVAVGAVVPFAAARVGAVASQAYANTAYGPDALAMLKRGIAPKDVVKKLLTSDKDAAQRQVGVVDARGRAASYTRRDCFPWAGHVVGRNFAAQGNILAGEEVLKALARAFEVTKGDLPVRLLAVSPTPRPPESSTKRQTPCTRGGQR